MTSVRMGARHAAIALPSLPTFRPMLPREHGAYGQLLFPLLTALLVTKSGSWIVVGDGGFIARSPDGAWFSRVRLDVTADLEAIGACGDGPLVCVGDRGTVIVSRDDGRSWTPFATALDTHLWSVEKFGSGVLIGGDTSHHEMVGQSVSHALQRVALETRVPVINGVIVVNTLAQAEARCRGGIDRGAEFAAAALTMAALKRSKRKQLSR